MWVSSNRNQQLSNHRRGFTIVELLIVVVVIAILAAITIVAYNGIQNRTKMSAAQSAVSQANRKILAYAVDNAEMYPPSLAAAGITDTRGLEYTYSNTVSPRTYGVTATNGNFSYYISSTTAQPTSGGYIGHGQGGAAAITNLSTNPSFETNLTSSASMAGAGGVATATRATTGGQSGAAFARMTWNTPPTSMSASGLWLTSNANITSPVGKSYNVSGYIRNSWAGASFAINPVFYSGASVVKGELYGPSVIIPKDSWTRLSVAIPSVPADTEFITIRIRSNGGSLPITGSTFDVDSFMLTEDSQTLPNYADGATTNWVWNGVVNNSTSTGPPQL